MGRHVHLPSAEAARSEAVVPRARELRHSLPSQASLYTISVSFWVFVFTSGI